ncbi:Mobile element protein [Caballeronia sordidicola]|uniref:Mobile element protein n=1 Tax=Caballeronia sordidicola TaxID=196367 RepID=A0A226X171_CABSO|nr:Mobile element protein [Caballeronia sordidicola]
MDKPVIDDELRKQIEPLPPQSKPRREKYLGCRPVADRRSRSIERHCVCYARCRVGAIYSPRWIAALT